MTIVLDGTTGITSPQEIVLGSVGILTSNLTGGKLNVLTATDSKLVVNDGSTTGNVRFEAVNNAYSAYKPLEFNGTSLIFDSSGAEGMRLTSTGLGIGTSSPGAKLEIGALGVFRMQTGSTVFNVTPTAGAIDTLVWNTSNSGSAFAWNTNSTERMRLDPSGNLGLGTTPSAWSANNQTLEGPYGAVSLGTSLGTVLSAGAYYNAGWKYKSNSAARILLMDSNSFQFYNAPSGTLGAAITFTQAMTLDASGNLLVGTTSTYALPGSQSASVFTNTGFAVGNGTTSVLVQNNKLAFNASNFYVVNGNTGTGVGVYIANGNTSWSTFSDERLKDIIEPITNAASKVSTLRAVIGKYKIDAEGTRRSFLIAQDVQAVLPEAVDASNPEKLGVQYTEVIPLLVAAIKEQQAIITQLQADVAALKGQ